MAKKKSEGYIDSLNKWKAIVDILKKPRPEYDDDMLSNAGSWASVTVLSACGYCAKFMDDTDHSCAACPMFKLAVCSTERSGTKYLYWRLITKLELRQFKAALLIARKILSAVKNNPF